MQLQHPISLQSALEMAVEREIVWGAVTEGALEGVIRQGEQLGARWLRKSRRGRQKLRN